MKWENMDSLSDLTFSAIHRRVAWGMVGLLAGIGIGSCNHRILDLHPRRPTSVYPKFQKQLIGFPSAIRS